MIILDATNRSLEVLLDGAVATNQLPIVASCVDFADGFVPGASEAVTNNTTAVTAVAAPATGVQRQVKLLSVFNVDTAPAAVTLRYNFNGTLRIIFKAMLAVGDNLVYTDGEGFRVIDSAGFVKQTLLTLPLGVASGGTGQTSQTSAFDALAPTTTKGDLVCHNGTDNVRVSVGSDGQVLTADSAQSAGVRWGTGGGANAATQAEMEAASSTTVYAAPGRTQYHPGVAKAWVNLNGTGTIAINASHNVSSITDNGTGDYTVTWATAFSSANYSVACLSKYANDNTNAGTATTPELSRAASNPAAGAARVIMGNASGALVDQTQVHIQAWGDQ